MKGSKAIVGVFEYLDDALRAIDQTKEKNLDFRVYAPFYNHDIEKHATVGRSNVRKVTLTGALTGLTFGFSLAIMCSLDWPLRVSAKDIVSVPGFIVIGYECTILFGAIATLLALMHFCRLPDPFRKIGFDPRFTQDRFGVVVGCEEDRIDEIKDSLLKAGAEEVDVRDGL